MEITDSINDFIKKCDEVLKHLKSTIAGINLGAADENLLKSINIKTSYGNMKLAHLATISKQDAKTLLVKPYNPNDLKTITKAIEQQELGTINCAKGQIFLKIPPLTLNSLNEKKDQLKEHQQKSKDKIRQIRQKWRQSYHKNKNIIGEDLYDSMEKKIDKKVSEYQEKIQQIIKNIEEKINKLFNL